MMRQLLNTFISERFQAGQTSGTEHGYCMFLDLSDFTLLTQTLMEHGREGAELVSEILSTIFGPVIDLVHRHGGFITDFAGDAITALFGDEDRTLPLMTAQSIIDVIAKRGLHETKYGSFQLSVKIGLASGQFDWGIMQTPQQNLYFFKGPPINGSVRAEHHCGPMEIILDSSYAGLLSDHEIDIIEIKTDDGPCFLLKETCYQEIQTQHVVKTVSTQTIDAFFPDSVTRMPYKGEFRDIVSVFMGLTETLSHSEIEDVVRDIVDKADQLGGYYKSLDFGDKGTTSLIYFGAPIAHEDTLSRALTFINQMKLSWGDALKAGIAQGTVYAGIVGSEQRCTYTCIGDTVNLSARLMTASEFGSVLTSEAVATQALSQFIVHRRGVEQFKGFKKPISVFEFLHEHARIPFTDFQGDFFGRYQELEEIGRSIEPLFEGHSGGLVMIYGDMGIGKTRFLFELTKLYKTKVHPVLMQCDSILQKRLNPVEHFFESYFQQESLLDYNQKLDRFRKLYGAFLRQYKESSIPETREERVHELERIESYLAAVVGLGWSGSLYEQVSPAQRAQLVRHALKDFFIALSQIQPLMIVIDDIQWIDDESRAVFDVIGNSISDYPITIVASSRFGDDGSKPQLFEPRNLPYHDMTLTKLSQKSVTHFVEYLFAAVTENDIIDFVFERSGGNPLYIEQYCEFLKERQLVTREMGVWQLQSDSIEIPGGISELFIAQIDRLSFMLKSIVYIASILGKEFDSQVMKDMIGEILEGKNDHHLLFVQHHCEELIEEGVRKGLWNLLARNTYRFRHALLRDVAYNMQLKEQLKLFHSSAGHVLERRYENDESFYADIAFHYEYAENVSKAYDYYYIAADRCHKRFQPDFAHKYFVKALELHKQRSTVDDARSALLYDNLGCENLALGRLDKAQEFHEKALELELKLVGETHVNTARVYNNLGSVYWWRNDLKKAKEYMDKCIFISEQLDLEKDLDTAIHYNNLASLLNEMGQQDEAIDLFWDSIKLRKQHLGEDHPDIATVYTNISLAYFDKADYTNALKYCHKAVDMLESKLGPMHRKLAIPYDILGLIYGRSGDPDKSLVYAEKNYAIKEKLFGKTHPESIRAINNLGLAFLNKGELHKALVLFLKAISHAKHGGNYQDVDIAVTLDNIGNVYRFLGDFEKAGEHHRKSLEHLTRYAEPDHLNAVPSYLNWGKTYFSQGRLDQARTCFLQSLELVEQKKDFRRKGELMAWLAYSAFQSGDYGNAITYIDKHLDFVNETGNQTDSEVAYLTIALILTDQGAVPNTSNATLKRITTKMGMKDNAVEYFRTAIRQASQRNNREIYIHAQREFGKHCLIENKNEGAKQLEIAYHEAVERGMDGEKRKIEEVCKEHQISLTRRALPLTDKIL